MAACRHVVPRLAGTSPKRYPATPSGMEISYGRIPGTCLDCSNGSVRRPGTAFVDVANHRQQRGPDTRHRLDLQQLQPAVGERHRAGRLPCAQQRRQRRRWRSAAAVGGGILLRSRRRGPNITAGGAVHRHLHALRLRRPAAPACRSLEVTSRGRTVPQPNNAQINGALSTFEGFPSMPRIDTLTSTIATRGQWQPVYEYQIGSNLVTGTASCDEGRYVGPLHKSGRRSANRSSLLGAVADFPSGTLTFPVLRGARAPARNTVRPVSGAPAVANGTVIAFKATTRTRRMAWAEPASTTAMSGGQCRENRLFNWSPRHRDRDPETGQALQWPPTFRPSHRSQNAGTASCDSFHRIGHEKAPTRREASTSCRCNPSAGELLAGIGTTNTRCRKTGMPNRLGSFIAS